LRKNLDLGAVNLVRVGAADSSEVDDVFVDDDDVTLTSVLTAVDTGRWRTSLGGRRSSRDGFGVVVVVVAAPEVFEAFLPVFSVVLVSFWVSRISEQSHSP
jgi:hypothetical protein